MGKLDPNLLLLILAAGGGLFWYYKMGGAQTLANLGGAGAATGDPDEDVDPDPKAEQEEASTPEPSSPDVEEQWDDGKGTVYVIFVDGWMGINGRRMYPPDNPNWDRYYRMRKYNWRYRRCMAKYRNSSWCKNKERFCSGAWKNTPWCKGFKRGNGHSSHHYPSPRTPPRGSPPYPDTDHCPPSISKNGRTYRFTRDPMPDVMPAIFPPPYVKQGNCVYKLDNNQGHGTSGRDGWDGDRGGSSGGNNWWDRIGDAISGKTSFYTYNRIGNV